MDQKIIFIPFLGMMLLTMVVWFYMYFQRLSFIFGKNLDPQSFATTASKADQNINSRVISPSDNLSNLFEMPMLFYAVSLLLYVTKQVDGTYMVLAYAYLGFRVLHSIIHCTYNKVVHRFLAYVISSILLWIMILRVCFQF